MRASQSISRQYTLKELYQALNLKNYFDLYSINMVTEKENDTYFHDNSKRTEKLTIYLDKNLFNYLSFLEKIRRIENKEEAIISAIRIFKKLNMQDWFPTVYRIGQERVIITPTGIIHDLLSTMDEKKLYDTSKMIAINRKSLDFFDHELDLHYHKNWDVILNEMENFGWGQFELNNSNIQVKQSVFPKIFIKGYLETLFNVQFKIFENIEKDYTLKLKDEKEKNR
jgi:hypothetical protein